MGVRRFLNLFVGNRARCTYSLRRLDLSRNQFFYPTPEEVASHGRVLTPVYRDSSSSLKKTNGQNNKQQASDFQTIRLPAPIFNLRPAPRPSPKWDELRLDAFALSQTNIMFADRQRNVITYDTDSHCFVTMPALHAPKVDPMAISMPHPGGCDGSLYIIEKLFRPEKSFQFEALVSDKHSSDSHPCRTWQCHDLPLPPIEREAFICSLAVVGNFICISAAGIGTYCFDTVSHSWSRAGDWVMPFFGTAEYIPEFNLWFGVSAQDYYLPCAADLSPVVRGQRPEPGFVWWDNHLPEEWDYSGILNPARIVSLGSGKFCIIRFFETRIPGLDADQFFVEKEYAVFTGLEVVLAGNGNGNSNSNGSRLRMIRHKSRRFRNVESSFIECLL